MSAVLCLVEVGEKGTSTIMPTNLDPDDYEQIAALVLHSAICNGATLKGIMVALSAVEPSEPYRIPEPLVIA